MKGKSYDLAVLLLLGAVSGVASFYLVRATYWGVLFLPGLVFGIIVGFYFFKRLNLQYFWFVIASMLSYCWSVLAVLSLTYGWDILANPTETLIVNTYISSPLVVFAGGLLGTLFLLFAFRQFVASPSRDAFLLLLLIGSALSSSFFAGYLADFAFPQQRLDLPINQLFLLFLLWQAGMAVALGWAVSSPVARKKLFVPIVVMIFVMVFMLLISNSLMNAEGKSRNITPVFAPR